MDQPRYNQYDKYRCKADHNFHNPLNLKISPQPILENQAVEGIHQRIDYRHGKQVHKVIPGRTLHVPVCQFHKKPLRVSPIFLVWPPLRAFLRLPERGNCFFMHPAPSLLPRTALQGFPAKMPAFPSAPAPVHGRSCHPLKTGSAHSNWQKRHHGSPSGW